MDSYSAYKILFKSRQANDYGLFYQLYHNSDLNDFLFDVKYIQKQHRLLRIDYDNEMKKIFRILSNKKQREIVLQAFDLKNITSNSLENNEIISDDRIHLYHDILKEDSKKMLTTVHIEFDTAIGLIVNMYDKFLCIQEKLCKELSKVYNDSISIDEEKIQEKINCFDNFLDSLKNNKDVEHIQNDVNSYISYIMNADYTRDRRIQDLILDQWIIIGISHCLHYNDEILTPSLKELYDIWCQTNDMSWIIRLNEVCKYNEDYNEQNLIEDYSRFNIQVFYLSRFFSISVHLLLSS